MVLAQLRSRRVQHVGLIEAKVCGNLLRSINTKAHESKRELLRDREFFLLLHKDIGA